MPIKLEYLNYFLREEFCRFIFENILYKIKSMKFIISDEDGLIALVNTNEYKTFVNEEWSLKQLFEHFIIQMNRQHLIIWKTNDDGGSKWVVDVLFASSGKHAFREFNKTINVTDGKLYLVTYSDITMAAQFEDEVLPSKQNSNLEIALENGIYNSTVRQIFDPKNYDYKATKETSFEIIFTKITADTISHSENVFWWDEN